VSIACHEYSWVICVGQCFSILDRTNCVLSASSERTISKDCLTLCMGRNGKHLSHTDTCYRLRLSPRRLQYEMHNPAFEHHESRRGMIPCAQRTEVETISHYYECLDR
jgi:hypothetical protein